MCMGLVAGRVVDTAYVDTAQPTKNNHHVSIFGNALGQILELCLRVHFKLLLTMGGVPNLLNL